VRKIQKWNSCTTIRVKKIQKWTLVAVQEWEKYKSRLLYDYKSEKITKVESCTTTRVFSL